MFYYAIVEGTVDSKHKIESGVRYNVKVNGLRSSSKNFEDCEVTMYRVANKTDSDLSVGDRVKVVVGDTSYEGKSYNGTKHIIEVLEKVSEKATTK